MTPIDDFDSRLSEDFLAEMPERAVSPEHDVRAMNKMDRHQAKLAVEFAIKGVGVKTAAEVMDWIVEETYKGASLLELSEIQGAPSLRKITAWKRSYPSFAEELKDAERVRGYVVVERAFRDAKNADRDTAAAAKTHFQAATWQASKLDPDRYTERKIEEHNHTGLENQSTSELLDRLRSSIGANTEVIRLLSEKERKAIGLVIDVETIPEGSPPMSP